jgi:hypothetical protein
MKPNFAGRSPFFIASLSKKIEIMEIFKGWKS